MILLEREHCKQFPGNLIRDCENYIAISKESRTKANKLWSIEIIICLYANISGLYVEGGQVGPMIGGELLDWKHVQTSIACVLQVQC